MLLLRYMLLRCRDLWCCCYVICCYAAEISGVVATLYVATLQRSLVLLLRYMLLRCRDLWCCCYVICCYAAEISGVVATLYVVTLQRSLGLLLLCVDDGVGWGGAYLTSFWIPTCRSLRGRHPYCSFQLPNYLQKFPSHSFQLMVSDT